VKLKRTNNGKVSFLCPGCGDHHVVPVEGPGAWLFNGSFERPTLQPSLLVRSGHYASSHKEGDPCWCGKDYDFKCYQCHSFVTDGKIQFLTDCSHELRGQTVDLATI
jgi:hypothetical protein